MASTLTPTMTIATLGLIKDKGLDINASLLTTITSLRTTGISGAVNTLMPSANSNPPLSTALHSIPSFLSGLITTAPVGFNSSILVAEIQSQANLHGFNWKSYLETSVNCVALLSFNDSLSRT